jgi:hypothetical protein
MQTSPVSATRCCGNLSLSYHTYLAYAVAVCTVIVGPHDDSHDVGSHENYSVLYIHRISAKCLISAALPPVFP